MRRRTNSCRGRDELFAVLSLRVHPEGEQLGEFLRRDRVLLNPLARRLAAANEDGVLEPVEDRLDQILGRLVEFKKKVIIRMQDETLKSRILKRGGVEHCQSAQRSSERSQTRARGCLAKKIRQ